MKALLIVLLTLVPSLAFAGPAGKEVAGAAQGAPTVRAVSPKNLPPSAVSPRMVTIPFADLQMLYMLAQKGIEAISKDAIDALNNPPRK